MAKKSKRDAAQENAEKKSRVQNVFGHPVRNMIVAAVVSILIGMAFIVRPMDVSQYCGYGVGGVIGVVGLIYIILYFCHRPVSGEYRSEFALGLLAVLAGAYVALSGLISSSGGVGYVLAIKILGILIIADGMLKLQYSVDIGRMRFQAWWIVLIFAVIGIGIGVMTVTDFNNNAMTMNRGYPESYLYNLGSNLNLKGNTMNASFYSGMMMLGIAFCVNGVLDLASLMVIAIRNQRARRDEAIIEATAMVAAAKREEIDEIIPAEIPAPSAEPVIVSVPEPEAAPSAEPVISEPEPEPAPAPEIPDPVQATPME